MSQLAQKQRQIVAATSAWLGTPYKHQSRIRGVGVDCAQLLIAVYQTVGELPPDFEVANYPIDFGFNRDEERYLNHVLNFAKPVEKPCAGDIAVFKFGRVISHAGIVSQVDPDCETYPFIIHAYRPERAVVVSDLMRSAYLQAHFAGFYRLKTLFEEGA